LGFKKRKGTLGKEDDKVAKRYIGKEEEVEFNLQFIIYLDVKKPPALELDEHPKVPQN